MKILKMLICGVVLMMMLGCVPNIYLIDRPTLLEEEAAGDWPDLEKESERGAVKENLEPLSPEQMERGTERVLQTLEGEPGIKAPKETKPETPKNNK